MLGGSCLIKGMGGGGQNQRGRGRGREGEEEGGGGREEGIEAMVLGTSTILIFINF